MNAKLQETHALNVRLAIIAREKRESARRAAAERAREKARRKKANRHPLQDLWDRNGAAIYDANQAFKTKYGKNMSTKVRRKAIKDATVNGRFNAGAYAGNLVKAATPPPSPKKKNPYAGAADRIRAAANEIDDEKKIGYVDSERDEVRKLIALNEQKNAPIDSATASYMAMAAAAEAGKFDKDDYDKARKQAENNALKRGLRAYYEGRKAGEEKDPLAEYMRAQDWSDKHALEALEYGHKPWTPDESEIQNEKINFKDFLREAIPAEAEWLHNNMYLPVMSFATKYPVLAKVAVGLVNIPVWILKDDARMTTSHNPNTMSWIDLGKTWLYELGDNDSISFGPDAKLTQDVMRLHGVQQYRTEAINDIQAGGSGSIDKWAEFGTERYYASLSNVVKADEGHAAELYLGSYRVQIDTIPINDTHYLLNYEVSNPSTWASFTRLMDDINFDGQHDSIIPDTSPRGEGIRLGGRLDQSFTWTEEIDLSEASGE